MTPARKELDMDTYSGRFAARLKELRLKAKLTPEEVAEALDVSTRTVYSWESARSFPNVDLLPRIAETLKLKAVAKLFP
ncbi:MAG: helix-turn-helix transcriptional regulator [Thermoguttaceae bacterium]|nr:helix-turn-helix transcriptional regulator [Thermoguttaceae bacterium]MBR4834233.1 helix-turn-helix transcriptional regulator [Thermoguttaceae bacterium]